MTAGTSLHTHQPGGHAEAGLHAGPKGTWLQPLALAATIATYTQRPAHSSTRITCCNNQYNHWSFLQPLEHTATGVTVHAAIGVPDASSGTCRDSGTS